MIHFNRWIGSFHSSIQNPPMTFFLRAKSKSLQRFTRPNTIQLLTSLTASSTNISLLFTLSTQSILTSLLILTQNFCLRAWVLLTNTPVIWLNTIPQTSACHSLPPSGMCSINKFSRIFSWPYFKLNPTHTSSTLFPHFIFLCSTPCHRMTDHILTYLLLIFLLVECMLHESRHFVCCLIPSIKNSA